MNTSFVACRFLVSSCSGTKPEPQYSQEQRPFSDQSTPPLTVYAQSAARVQIAGSRQAVRARCATRRAGSSRVPSRRVLVGRTVARHPTQRSRLHGRDSSSASAFPLERAPRLRNPFARIAPGRSIHNAVAMAGAVRAGNPAAWMRGDSAPARDAESAHRLIAAAQSGDTAACGRLIELHQQRVFRTARAILGNDADAQDAAQEAFLGAFRHLASFDPKRDLAAWLYRLTVNACRDMTRRRTRVGTAEIDTEALVARDPGPFEATALQEQRDLTRRAIARLPYKERAAITLRDLEGPTTAEVAVALGTTQAAVRSQVSAARSKLRRYILGDRRSQR